MTVPGYWMDETSGVLRPAVTAYLAGDEHIAELRREVDLLTNREEIERWLGHALDVGIDPL